MEHKGDLHPQVVLEDAGGKILDFYYLPEKAHIEVNEGQMISAGTLLAKTPREVVRYAGHHGRSAARDGNLRSSQAEGSGRHRRNRRHGRTAGRKAPRQADDHRPQRKRHRTRASWSRTASTCVFTRATIVRAGDALVDGPLVPHDILRISGEEAVQQYLTARNSERLSQPARGDQRQAHRDHRRADAAQGADRDAGRHQPAAGQRDGQVRLPSGERAIMASA